MRVCLDARTVSRHFPGIGRYTLNLARALVLLLECDEHLTLLQPPGRGPGAQLGARTGVVDTVEIAATPFSPRQHWVVPAQLRRSRADVYHSPYFLMPLRPGTRTVLTVHDVIPLRDAQAFPRWKRAVLALALRRALRTADHVIAVSEHTARDVEATFGVERERMTVVHEAPDPCFVPAPAEQVARTRERLGLPPEYVLYAGANRPHKNLERLIEAWARLQPRSGALVVAGPWDARYDSIRTRAEERCGRKAVRFVGWVGDEELCALYSGATAFVLPSEDEGFGLPALEAMACGAAVACAGAASLPEITGDAALRFDPRDVEDIARALETLLDDRERREGLARAGRRRAAEFRWEAAAARTLDVYRSVLRGSRHEPRSPVG